MKSAIVTGANGFIGSWLCQELIKNRINTTVIVRNKEKLLPKISNNSCVTIIEKEINDLRKDDFSHDKTYDCFYHLAWGYHLI